MTSHPFRSPRGRGYLRSIAAAASAVLGLLGFLPEARAVDIDWIIVTPDVPVEVLGTRSSDRAPAFDAMNWTHWVNIDLGPLPENTSIDAHERIFYSMELFSVEAPTTMPNGLEVEPEDVVRWNGRGDYRMIFDGSAAGVPSGVNLDGVAVLYVHPSAPLLLSFDSSVSLGGIYAEDEDVVKWSGGQSFSLFLDASEAGIDPALDLDGLDFRGEESDLLFLSFDGSGQLGWIEFDDEDVISFEKLDGIWDFPYDPGYVGSGPGRDMNTQSVAVPTPEPGFGIALMMGVGLLTGLFRRPQATVM